MQVIDYNVITLRGKRYIEFPFMEKFGIKLMLSSSDAYRSFDAPEEKILDLSAAYGYFGTNKDWVFSGYQRHGTNIEIIKSLENYPKGSDEYFGFEFENTDGLMTRGHFTLLTKFADCTPVVIFDPKNKVLCNLHSGWRGTQQKISPKAVQLLIEGFGSDPKELIVFMGPALGAEDFEVGDDLIELFNDSHDDISSYLIKKNKEKSLFDMTSLLKDDLLSLGILEEHIFTTHLSTFKNPLMHSYRRDGDESGRMLLFARILD